MIWRNQSMPTHATKVRSHFSRSFFVLLACIFPLRPRASLYKGPASKK